MRRLCFPRLRREHPATLEPQAIRGELQKVLAKGPSAEVNRRATQLLRQFEVVNGPTQAAWLMLIPLVYLIAARLWRGHSPERPLMWVSHTATAVILVHVLLASVHLLRSRDGRTLGLDHSRPAYANVVA